MEAAENDLLFSVQGVGQEKEINGMRVFVKHEDCEESLKDLNKLLAGESSFEPVVRLILGKWKFVKTHLSQIIVVHHENKALAY